MHTGLTLEESKADNAQMSPFEIFSLIQDDLLGVWTASSFRFGEVPQS